MTAATKTGLFTQLEQALPPPGVPSVPACLPLAGRAAIRRRLLLTLLLALGLDTNHGFAKVAVENSEVAKRRMHLEQRLARLKQWAQSAGKREALAGKRTSGTECMGGRDPSHMRRCSFLG